MNDDIEAIEETLPKLESFYTSYGGISTSVDGLHDQLDKFSTSAVSSEGVENKNKALQVRTDVVHCDWSIVCVQLRIPPVCKNHIQCTYIFFIL